MEDTEMGFIDYEVEGAVGIITINRPKALNALNEDVLNDLEAAFDAVDLNTVRCLILTGAGDKSFVAGADIGAMSKMTKAEGTAFGKKGNDIFLKIEKFPIPVIAAINGFALGGGCEISMSCDIRICSENAMFGQPEVGLGITPGFGGTQRLARLIGAGMAKQLIYTARNIKADEAYRICPQPRRWQQRSPAMLRSLSAPARRLSTRAFRSASTKASRSRKSFSEAASRAMTSRKAWPTSFARKTIRRRSRRSLSRTSDPIGTGER